MKRKGSIDRSVLDSLVKSIKNGNGIIETVKEHRLNYSDVRKDQSVADALREAKYALPSKEDEVIKSEVVKEKSNTSRAVVRYVITDLLFKMKNDGSYEDMRDDSLDHLYKTKVIEIEERNKLQIALDSIFDVMKRAR